MKIAIDKQKHMAAGAIVSLSAFFIGPQQALILAFIVGAYKEVWDYFFGGTVDLWDIVYTVLGALPLCLIAGVI